MRRNWIVVVGAAGAGSKGMGGGLRTGNLGSGGGVGWYRRVGGEVSSGASSELSGVAIAGGVGVEGGGEGAGGCFEVSSRRVGLSGAWLSAIVFENSEDGEDSGDGVGGWSSSLRTRSSVKYRGHAFRNSSAYSSSLKMTSPRFSA